MFIKIIAMNAESEGKLFILQLSKDATIFACLWLCPHRDENRRLSQTDQWRYIQQNIDWQLIFWLLLSVIFWLTKCFSCNFGHGRKRMGLFHDFKLSSSQPLLSYIALLSIGTSTCANTVSRWFSMVWFPLRSFTSLNFPGLASDPNSDVKAWHCRREDRLIYFGFPLTVLNAEVCSWLLPE